jgi:farnesyl-diphosphate farnesyltransferase
MAATRIVDPFIVSISGGLVLRLGGERYRAAARSSNALCRSWCDSTYLASFRNRDRSGGSMELGFRQYQQEDPLTSEALSFCRRILPAVSRTFALSIRVLPGPLGQAVMTAYLICRIADTIEDEPNASPDEKARLLDRLLECFESAEAADRFPDELPHLRGESSHIRLARHTNLVFRLYRTLQYRSRRSMQRWIGEMIRGMRKFVLLYPAGIRIRSLEEYREYCYYVAGTVGYLLTDLWYEHSESIDRARFELLRARCRAFAEALQTVNILKDIAQDAERENSIYIPAELLLEEGSSQATIIDPLNIAANHRAISTLVRLAWADLDEALEYLLLVPRRALAIRVFCVLPLLFAYATMRELARTNAMLLPGGVVKISRGEVRTLLVLGPIAVVSNHALRRLVRRVRVEPIVVAGAKG